jgi:hypothetical protein
MTPGQTTDANPGAVAMPSGESGRTALFPSSTPRTFIAHQAPVP